MEVEECDAVLTDEEVERLKNSQTYLEALKVFDKARAGIELTAQEFSDARDLLLTRLALATGTRPAPLQNATLDDCHRAKTKEGNKIILVAKHKTAAAGPAILGLDEKNQDLMGVYIEKVRPQVALETEQRIFVKIDDEGFAKGTIGKRSSVSWQKSGVASSKNVGHTSIRKFISTKTHEMAPESADAVAKVMSHSRQNAKRSYVRSELTSVGSSAMQVIANVTSGASTSGVSILPPTTLYTYLFKKAPINSPCNDQS